MSDFSSLGDIFNLSKKNKAKKVAKRTVAHEFQDFALRIIKDLDIPDFKRSAVFRICKDYPKDVINRAVADTKELCHTPGAWRYFFKMIALDKSKKSDNNSSQD